MMFKFCLLLSCAASFICAAQTLKVNSTVPIEFLKTHASYGILKQAMAELNLKVEFQNRPLVRSWHEIDSGVIDGDFSQVHFNFSQFENIIRVDESVSHISVVAFYFKNRVPTIHSIEDLSQYRIGYIKGWRVYGELASDAKYLSAVADTTTLIKMLAGGRFDAVMIEKGLGVFTAQQLGYPEAKFATSPVLREMPLYFYLNKKHHKLAKTLAKSFISIKQAQSN